jgi:hypothetical protein
MELDEWAVSAQASVRIGEVRIAGVVDGTTAAKIATVTAGGGIGVRNLKCGRCFVKMTEVYADGRERYSWAVALKSGEVDGRAPLG